MKNQFLLALTLLVTSGLASIGIVVSRNEAHVSFPDSIRFELEASSPSVIQSAALEFGTDALSCGESVSRAYPEEFQAAKTVRVHWLWNLRQTGPLPPGTGIWWRWVLRDQRGAELVTPTKTLRFDDESLAWRSVEEQTIVLYWREGPEAFARQLLQAGVQALTDLQEMTGVVLTAETRVYVYGSSQEMQSATLFAPEWSGGLAFPRHHTILLAVSPDGVEWGQRALAHELAHVVVGGFTFSCVDSTPAWVAEGLAMAAEGPLEPYLQSRLDRAVREDRLLPLSSLGEHFSESAEVALLAYAQSKSLVDFLALRYGQSGMLDLLQCFREGLPEDQALQTAFGLDRAGLEAAWREWLGASPPAASANAGGQATRTPYPTLSPITGPPLPATPTPAAERHPTEAAPAVARCISPAAAVLLITAGSGSRLCSLFRRGKQGGTS